MRIRELSRLTSVSIRSLRYYEQKGLIKPRRLENGYRDYDESAIKQVKAIQLYLELGLNTDEIKRIADCKGEHFPQMDYPVCERAMIDFYQQKMQAIDDEIQTLADIKKLLMNRIRQIQNKEIQFLQGQTG